MTDLSEEETITLRRVLINRYVRQLAVDVRIAPENGRIRDTRSTSQKCQQETLGLAIRSPRRRGRSTAAAR